MAMDGTTAAILLDAIKHSVESGAISISNDEVADLYKGLNTDQGGPTQEAIDFFDKNKGKRCRIDGTDYTGVIEKLNTATAGFYPGSSFPIYVRIDATDSHPSYFFEYGLDQVIVLPE